MFTTITLAVCGFWLTSNSFFQKTSNFASSLTYKVIPFFCGLACIIAFLGRIGVMNIK